MISRHHNLQNFISQLRTYCTSRLIKQNTEVLGRTAETKRLTLICVSVFKYYFIYMLNFYT